MNENFQKQLRLPVDSEQAFAWHERLGALDRLIPPWEKVEVVKRGDGVGNGGVVELAHHLGPLKLKWVAEHHGYEQGRVFRDRQVRGPFAVWEHRHEFRADGDGGGMLTDHVEYRLPGGAAGRLLAGRLIRRKIDNMFTYRHNTTYDDLAAHARHSDRGSMQIAISGRQRVARLDLGPDADYWRASRHQAGSTRPGRR